MTVMRRERAESWPQARDVLGWLCIAAYGMYTSFNVWAGVPEILQDGGVLKAAFGIAALAVIWLLSMSMLFAAAWSRREIKWPLFALAALSAVVLGTYAAAAGFPLGYADWDGLWHARANLGDALQEYGSLALRPVAALVLLLVGFLLVRPRQRAGRWAILLFCGSVAAFVTTCVTKRGGATDHLPQTTALYGLVISQELDRPIAPYAYTTTERPALAPRVDNVVIVIDESIRHDFFDRVVLPQLLDARGEWHIHDFGQANSMANCSADTNIMLRKAVRASSITSDVYRNPLIWSYAHNAGFSTWLLDAQMHGVGSDYFDDRERSLIDHRPEVRTPRDTAIVAAMSYLNGAQRTFTIIIKRGSHFPYANNYPSGYVSSSPVIQSDYVRESIKRQQYVDAIDWQTGGFFHALMKMRVSRPTMVIYTSDHGQNVGDWEGLTHCNFTPVVHADEGVVPLLVLTNYASPELERAAEFNRDRASHFNIMPTALQVMGYDVDHTYPAPSGPLTEPQSEVAGFTYGSPFSHFGSTVRWEPVDRDKYRELDQARWNARQ